MTTGPDFRNRANYIDVLRRDVSLGGFRQCSFDGVLAVGDCDGRNALGATFGTPLMWLEAALLYGTPCRFHDTNPQHASSAVCATMLAVARAVNSAIACQMNVLF